MTRWSMLDGTSSSARERDRVRGSGMPDLVGQQESGGAGPDRIAMKPLRGSQAGLAMFASRSTSRCNVAMADVRSSVPVSSTRSLTH